MTLILILALILVVVVLSNVALVFIRNQVWHIHYQVERIRAHYAAQAGINYAMENLRLGSLGVLGGWTPETTHQHFCINDDGTLSMNCADGNFNDADLLPYRVQIHVFPEGLGVNGTTELEVSVTY